MYGMSKTMGFYIKEHEKIKEVDAIKTIWMCNKQNTERNEISKCNYRRI